MNTIEDLTQQQMRIGRVNDFMRYLSLLYEQKGYETQAAQLFCQRYPRSLSGPLMQKPATTAGTTTDVNWAGPLAPLKPMADSFLEDARPTSLIGRIAGLHYGPFNVSFPVVTAPSVAGWAGESASNVKAISVSGLGTVTLTVAKVADIVVVTGELVRAGTANALAVLRDELARAVNAFVDKQFVDPAKALVGGVSPASITNGITPIAPSGTTAAALKTDVGTLIAQFANANPDITTAVLLLPPKEAAMLNGSMVNPTISLTGVGSYAGFPTVVSGAMATAIVLVDAHAIAIADDGVELGLSTQAAVQMNDAPDSPAVATSVVTSFWQQDLVGLRAERFITWKRARTSAVSLISPCAYVAGT